MKIYRAEDEQHHGAHQFCGKGIDCHDNDDIFWPIDRKARPPVTEDGFKPMIPICHVLRTCDMRFGFNSLAAAKKWFHETALRAKQSKWGVKIFTYEAEPLDQGRTGQVAFALDRAKKLPEVYNFETFEREDTSDRYGTK